MKPRELFDVVIRSLGVLIVAALWIAFWTVVTWVFRDRGPFVMTLLFGIPVLFLGLWLLGSGANVLVSLLYPEDESPQDGVEDEPASGDEPAQT